MKGHNYNSLCRKCGILHIHPRGMLDKKHGDETKISMSQNHLGITRRKGCPDKRPESKLKRSISAKKLWSNPEHARRMTSLFSFKPNKMERLDALLIESFPREWRYTGDGKSIWIAGKCPDFFRLNNKKQLIEFCGEYWHTQSEVQSRVEHYAKYGFKCLVIWERELKDILTIIQRVKKFMEE